ncbi:MAG: hypothetical protein ABIH92_04665 [Nanoarchaeota archaeon]
MQKEEIRKEFFKLKIKGHSYPQYRKILKLKFNFEVTARTLMRWNKKLSETEWDLRDESRRPNRVHTRTTSETEKKIIKLKKETGWGEDKIENFVDVGHTTVNKILNKHELCKETKRKKKRNKYVDGKGNTLTRCGKLIIATRR